MEVTPRSLNRNNKRGPKAKRKPPGTINREIYKLEKLKEIHPAILKNAIKYILQYSDTLMWKVLSDSKIKAEFSPHFWEAYGLRHAVDLLERFIFNTNNHYRDDLKQPKEKKCDT